MERQYHGFMFEEEVLKNFSYMSNLDFFTLSCKKGAELCLSDLFKFANRKDDFILVVGVWDVNRFDIQNFETYFFYINKEFVSNNIPKKILPKLKNLINEITNDISDDIKWKNEISKYRSLWKENAPNSIIKPRFKRDHKSQKRMQCAISYSDFIKMTKGGIKLCQPIQALPQQAQMSQHQQQQNPKELNQTLINSTPQQKQLAS